MAITAYRVEIQPNLAKLQEAVSAVLETEIPYGQPFETKSGGWAQAMVTEEAAP